MADRAVAPAISYVLIIGIIAILTAGLVSSFAPLVTNQQSQAVRSTLDVFGQDVAGDIESVDRLVDRAGENGTVQLRTELPERVGGNLYNIEIEQSGNRTEIRLRTTDPEILSRTTVRTQTDIQDRTGDNALDGGNLVIRYDEANDRLVVENA